MDTKARNQQIVSRAMRRETFAAIGKALDPPISRERVRQIFNKTATPAQVKALNAAAPAVPLRTKMARREPKTRLHLLIPPGRTLTHDEIRHGMAKWAAGRLGVVITEPSEPLTERLDILLPVSLEFKFRGKCATLQVTPSAAIRAIIAKMESLK